MLWCDTLLHLPESKAPVSPLLGHPLREAPTSLSSAGTSKPAGQGRPRFDGRLPWKDGPAPGCYPLLAANSWLALGAPCTGKRNAQTHSSRCDPLDKWSPTF